METSKPSRHLTKLLRHKLPLTQKQLGQLADLDRKKRISKRIYIIFGRFQPPTIGHEVLFKTAVRRAQTEQAKVALFVSQTQDRKNPLSYSDRVAVIQNSVPGLLIGPKTARTPAEALTWAFGKGYRDLILLVGDDRTEGFSRMAKSWQNAEDPEKETTVKVQDLPRTGAMDASKVSGTVARKYAQQGNLDKFKEILISGAKNNRTAQRFMRIIQDQLGRLKEMFMTKKQPLTEADEDAINRVVRELMTDSSWYRTDEVPAISVEEPDNRGDIDSNSRVPEDTSDNMSVIVIHPARRLKFDAKAKAQRRQEEVKKS